METRVAQPRHTLRAPAIFCAGNTCHMTLTLGVPSVSAGKAAAPGTDQQEAAPKDAASRQLPGDATQAAAKAAQAGAPTTVGKGAASAAEQQHAAQGRARSASPQQRGPSARAAPPAAVPAGPGPSRLSAVTSGRPDTPPTRIRQHNMAVASAGRSTTAIEGVGATNTLDLRTPAAPKGVAQQSPVAAEASAGAVQSSGGTRATRSSTKKTQVSAEVPAGLEKSGLSAAADVPVGVKHTGRGTLAEVPAGSEQGGRGAAAAPETSSAQQRPVSEEPTGVEQNGRGAGPLSGAPAGEPEGPDPGTLRSRAVAAEALAAVGAAPAVGNVSGASARLRSEAALSLAAGAAAAAAAEPSTPGALAVVASRVGAPGGGAASGTPAALAAAATRAGPLALYAGQVVKEPQDLTQEQHAVMQEELIALNVSCRCGGSAVSRVILAVHTWFCWPLLVSVHDAWAAWGCRRSWQPSMLAAMLSENPTFMSGVYVTRRVLAVSSVCIMLSKGYYSTVLSAAASQ